MGHLLKLNGIFKTVAVARREGVLTVTLTPSLTVGLPPPCATNRQQFDPQFFAAMRG